MAGGFAGGRFDGVDTAERGERGFTGQPVGVVTCGDEQGCGGVGPDPVAGQQVGCAGSDDGGQVLLVRADLGVEGLNAAGEHAQDVSCGLAIAVGLEMSLGWKIGSVIAFLGIREWNFLAPTRIGDTIRVWGKWPRFDPRSPNRTVGRTVVTRVQLRNQEDVVCQEGLWTMLFSRRASGPGSASEGV